MDDGGPLFDGVKVALGVFLLVLVVTVVGVTLVVVSAMDRGGDGSDCVDTRPPSACA